MDIEDALYTYLSTYSGLTDLVSTRIYPDIFPQEVVPPAVVFTRESGPREMAMGSRPGIAYPRYKFTALASTKTSAVDVVDQLRAALDYYSGTMGGESGVEVLFSRVDDEYDEEPDSLLQGDAAQKYRMRSAEFIIHHRE